MLEFFSGLVSMLLWLPLGIFGFVQQVVAPMPEQKLLANWQPGLVYSVKQAENLGLEANQTYLAILSELRPEYLRLIAYWDRIEKEQGNFDFSELDFQMQEANKRGIKTTLILGRKVPRWPECHLPQWYSQLSQKEQGQATLNLIEQVVKRYRDYPNLEYWQVENEVFFEGFGACPRDTKQLLNQELALLKTLDDRPVLSTSSGELDTWLRSFLNGDKVGISIYRRFFVTLPFLRLGLDYPLPPLFYQTKARLFQLFFKKDILVTEFQLEPWLDKSLQEVPVREQFQELDLMRFEKYVNYALQTRIKRVYFWGVEWWYWLKLNGYPEIFDYAKQNIFFY